MKKFNNYFVTAKMIAMIPTIARIGIAAMMSPLTAIRIMTIGNITNEHIIFRFPMQVLLQPIIVQQIRQALILQIFQLT